jgi:Domain of unknown function (DUF6891)
MASLKKAFNRMGRRGLIAKPECYGEHDGRQKILATARRWRKGQRKVRGFVHVGTPDPAPSAGETRVPLVFGLVAGDTLVYRGRRCVPVGEAVAACLAEQGLPYEWDRVPGHPILVGGGAEGGTAKRVELLVHLFRKPGEELDEGEEVTAAQLRALGQDLQERLQEAADVVEKLTGAGWETQMALYDVVLSHPSVHTAAQAEAQLRGLGIDPECVAVEEWEGDWDEELDDEGAG